jgi:hypothetical protein
MASGGLTNELLLALLHITEHASYRITLADVPKSRRSLARCFARLPKTLSVTSNMRPKSNTTNSPSRSAHCKTGSRRVQREVSGTSKHMFKRGFPLKTVVKGYITARRTSTRQFTIIGNISSFPTKHTLILLPKARAVSYASKAHDMMLRIYKKWGKRRA